VSQRQRMGKHLVARGQAGYLPADRGDHARRLHTKHQRRLAAHVPVADPDELVPVADPCSVHPNDDLVGRGRGRRRQLEQAHLAAERLDAGGLHPSHRHHPQGSSPSMHYFGHRMMLVRRIRNAPWPGRLAPATAARPRSSACSPGVATGSSSRTPMVRSRAGLQFHGCEQLLAGLLAAAAGFGAHAAVLVHRGVSVALVSAALARRHARLQQ
jgi:hypothetical protein